MDQATEDAVINAARRRFDLQNDVRRYVLIPAYFDAWADEMDEALSHLDAALIRAGRRPRWRHRDRLGSVV